MQSVDNILMFITLRQATEMQKVKIRNRITIRLCMIFMVFILACHDEQIFNLERITRASRL